MKNVYIPSDISRLRIIPIQCAKLLYNDINRSIPDFKMGKCICNNNRMSQIYDPYCASKPISNNNYIEIIQPCTIYNDIELIGVFPRRSKLFNNDKISHF